MERRQADATKRAQRAQEALNKAPPQRPAIYEASSSSSSPAASAVEEEETEEEGGGETSYECTAKTFAEWQRKPPEAGSGNASPYSKRTQMPILWPAAAAEATTGHKLLDSLDFQMVECPLGLFL